MLKGATVTADFVVTAIGTGTIVIVPLKSLGRSTVSSYSGAAAVRVLGQSCFYPTKKNLLHCKYLAAEHWSTIATPPSMVHVIIWVKLELKALTCLSFCGKHIVKRRDIDTSHETCSVEFRNSLLQHLSILQTIRQLKTWIPKGYDFPKVFGAIEVFCFVLHCKNVLYFATFLIEFKKIQNCL